jgi:hypothetical protein
MYVPPEALQETFESLNLKPFDSKSTKLGMPVSSASERLANNRLLDTLKVSLDVSTIAQFCVASVLLIINHLGLNPININGPSVEPFPVYEPNAEYPAIGAKQ